MNYRAPIDVWQRFWYQDRSTVRLDIIRIFLGLSVFSSYISLSPELLEFYGDGGWVSKSALQQEINNPLFNSLLFYITESWQLVVFHVVFLISCFLLTVGSFTSVVKWVVFVGHLSYIHRNPLIMYGADNIIASLLFLLCLAPIGRSCSIDRWRKLKREKRKDLNAISPLIGSMWGHACIRLIQLQMTILFFLSGIEKLRGNEWVAGDALWVAITNYEYQSGFVDILAQHYWLTNILSYSTILIEIAYPFLIWGKKTRALILVGAFALHAGIAAVLGLYLFAFVMCVGHLAFLRHEWLTELSRWWKNKTGPMEMIYDGDCGFCYRSMTWFLAFDGLGQIHARNFRKEPSPTVSDAELERALYLVTDTEKLAGFDAYRYAVIRVPGLWWMIPAFYIPFFSRYFGRNLYRKIASNRYFLSRRIT